MVYPKTGPAFSVDLKTNGGLVIESGEEHIDLSANFNNRCSYVTEGGQM